MRTRLRPNRLWRKRAAMATLLNRQNPIAQALPAVLLTDVQQGLYPAGSLGVAGSRVVLAVARIEHQAGALHESLTTTSPGKRQQAAGFALPSRLAYTTPVAGCALCSASACRSWSSFWWWPSSFWGSAACPRSPGRWGRRLPSFDERP